MGRVTLTIPVFHHEGDTTLDLSVPEKYGKIDDFIGLYNRRLIADPEEEVYIFLRRHSAPADLPAAYVVFRDYSVFVQAESQILSLVVRFRDYLDLETRVIELRIKKEKLRKSLKVLSLKQNAYAVVFKMGGQAQVYYRVVRCKETGQIRIALADLYSLPYEEFEVLEFEKV